MLRMEKEEVIENLGIPFLFFTQQNLQNSEIKCKSA